MLIVKEPGLFETDIQGKVNLFTGSGFSTLAKNQNDLELPTGGKLQELLVEKFDRSDLRELDLQSLYTVIANGQKANIDRFLVKTYSVSDYSPKYGALRHLNISHLYTTNIDNLPEKIFAPRDGEESPIFHDVSVYGEPRDIDSSIQYVPLHGSVNHEKPKFIFSGGQISSAFASDQQTWFVFQRELQIRPTFFLGYGMKDAGVLQALHATEGQTARRWVLIRPDQPEAKVLYDSLGFHIVEGDIEDFLDGVDALKIEKASNATMRRLPVGRVPRRDEIAQRPVRKFFLGAEPTWSDAYSPQIVKRRINNKVLDLALSGKSVAIVGLPLSGKSTIMRQVAIELSENRRVMYFDHISSQRANEILASSKEIKDDIFVFIDNFIDSRDGFNKLTKSNNFRFIVAETSTYYDSINAKRLGTPLVVVPCSEVSSQDLQDILESVPGDLKRYRLQSEKIGETAEALGLFEGLVQHVFPPELIQRFRESLVEFEETDSEAFDIYLMGCYANRCRTLVSYDMIHLYIGDQKRDYLDAYRAIERINDYIQEQEYELDDTQDHFSVKSKALARIALKNISNASFGRMFDQFHRNVSSKVIPDYQTFRRYAYDNDYAVKAYPDFRDGKLFYEKLIQQTDSPYDYQHAAVYMSKKGQYSKAFEWIDIALSKSGQRIFSIKNSHAVILFEANYEIYKNDPSDVTARDGIAQSMDVLQHLIEQDSWRRYHLLRFADQSNKLARIQIDDDIISWLQAAKSKLELALDNALKSGSRDSYNAGKYRRLLREVSQSLGSK